jgi:hypothetical protein
VGTGSGLEISPWGAPPRATPRTKPRGDREDFAPVVPKWLALVRSREHSSTDTGRANRTATVRSRWMCASGAEARLRRFRTQPS